MDTLMSQIEVIVRKEKRNQAWLPISRQQQTEVRTTKIKSMLQRLNFYITTIIVINITN